MEFREFINEETVNEQHTTVPASDFSKKVYEANVGRQTGDKLIDENGKESKAYTIVNVDKYSLMYVGKGQLVSINAQTMEAAYLGVDFKKLKKVI